MGIFLGCAQQLCGINVMFGYSGRIFNDMNLSAINSYQGSAIIGFFNAAAVFFTGKMLVSYGRKTLMYVFEFGMGLCLVGMAISSDFAQNDGPVYWNYIKLVCIILFVIFFEFSAGPIVWLYNAEIMQDKALTIATGFNWIACMLVGLLSPSLLSNYPIGIYYGYASIALASAAIEFMFMKETKGLSEDQLKKLYSK
jgi:MFS family permease